MALSRQKKLVLVLWLMPASPARDFLLATIESLARRYDAPIFEPHLTLGLRPEALTLPKQIAAEPVRLRPVGVFFSPLFTKTLFVRLQLTPGLGALRLSLGLGGADYDPHLSLLYRKLPRAEQARLARSVSFPFSMVSFDRISVVRCVSPTQSRADVEAWEILSEIKLRSRAGKLDHPKERKVSGEHNRSAGGVRRKE